MATCYCTKAECQELKEQIQKLWKEVKRLDKEKCETRECARIKEIAIEAKRKAIHVENDLSDHKRKSIPQAHKFAYKPKVDVNLSGQASGSSIQVSIKVSVDGQIAADSQSFNLKPNVRNDISLAASANGTLKVFSSVTVFSETANDSATVTIPQTKVTLPPASKNPIPILPLPSLPRVNFPKIPFPVGVGVPYGNGNNNLFGRGIGGGANNYQPVSVQLKFNQTTGVLTTTVSVGARSGTGSANIVDQEIKTNVKRIYQILGGDSWFANGDEPSLELDTESLVKGFVADQWGLDAEKESAEPATISDLVDAITAISSVSYFRQGLQEYPFEVPQDLTNIPGQGQAETLETIPYASKFSEWQFKQLDSLLGQFPIKIRIEDNDLIKTGDQPVEIQLPNIAETLAELIGKSITSEAVQHLHTNVIFRLLHQTGSDLKQNFQTYKTVQAIASYLGYDDAQKTEKLRLLYDPNYNPKDEVLPDFAELLKETEIDVIVDEVTEKQTLEQKLTALLFAASVITASHYKRVNPNSDEDWDRWVNSFKDLVNSEKEKKQKDDQKLDDFLEKVEEGFTGEAGIIDSTKPYGRPREQRPRIRKLGGDNNGID